MKYAIFFLATTLFSQETAKPTPPPPAATPMIGAVASSKSFMMVDPKARANDYIQVFDLLRKEKPTLKIMVRTQEGIFSNVTDMSVTHGGTLLIVKVLTNQGIKVQIVPVEEMMEINYSP